MTPWTIHHGNCLDVLAAMEPDSVDTILTDPPYHLTSGKRGGTGLASLNVDSPAGRSRVTTGFMGTTWDGGDIAQRPDVWRACLRVAKPGAFLLAFSGTRTWHRMACAIEDAGWEIRDTCMWLYGSGFPKSLDIAKAIDKRRHNRDEILAVTAWVRERRDAAGITNGDIDRAFGFNGMAGHWTTAGAQAAIATLDQWPRLMAVLQVDEVPAEIQRLAVELNGEKGKPGAAWFTREVVATRTDGVGNTDASIHKHEGFAASRSSTFDVTAPATDLAKQWQGWGTALKPAWEPILVAMKPCDGTFAQNAERHGVAGLNIDGARIPSAEKWDGGGPPKPREGGIGYASSSSSSSSHDLGRWPANLILDEDAAGLLDAATGELTSGVMKAGTTRSARSARSVCYGAMPDTATLTDTRGDSGGASRFFYTAKASRSERNIGDVDNKHPTVKPLDLMVYLCRLTATPKGGVILDPFCGSGTTGVAALRCGRAFIGIEQDAESVATARGRMGGDAPLFNMAAEARA